MKIFTKTRVAIGVLALISTAGLSSPAFAGSWQNPVTITSTAPPYAHVGDNYAVTATSTIPKPITIGVFSGSSSVCTVTPTGPGTALVTFIGPGKCVIYASQFHKFYAVQKVYVVQTHHAKPPYPPVPCKGHGYGGHKSGGHLTGYQGHNGGKSGKSGKSGKHWIKDATLASATVPVGSGAQASSGTGTTWLVGPAAVAFAFSGMFLLRSRRRRSRTAGGAA
jgi:hypothetical protein